MKKANRSFASITCTLVLVGLVASPNQSVFAGWSGLIDGFGKGWASVNVRSSTLVSNRVSTVNGLLSPSAAMAPATGYKTNAPLPSGASISTYSRIKGLYGGVWSATNNTANGDGADHPELQKRLKIAPADCAFLSFDSKIDQTPEQFAANGNSGTITVNALGTGGTALWLRGFEYTGPITDVPIDDPATTENESIEFLKVYGSEKFETLVAGPFEFGGPNCPLTIPFTLSTSNFENLIFATDAVTLSLPPLLVCPSEVVVSCEESFSYPAVQYAGCGDLKISYSLAPLNGPFPAGSFPVGITPVTVTLTDTNGNSTNCTFTVTVTDIKAPVPPALPILTGESSVTVTQPAPGTDNCGGVVTATTTDPLVYNTQGTFTVHWIFDDGHGNTSQASQTVIVDDVTAPTPPTIATASNQCSVTVTAPVAVDSVVGNITGTTSDPKTYNTQGTFTVHWSFNDGNGNISTANQTVIVKDTIAPVPDVATLPVVNGTCSTPALVNAPTATDNCAGQVTGTTTTVFPITALGTTVVTWTFSDGNGNKSTQTQTVNIAGLTFRGFYSPVGTSFNTVNNPVTRTAGASFPLKWDMLCGTTVISGGTPPTVDIQKVLTKVPLTLSAPTRLTAEFLNDWHVNWPTPNATKSDIYKATVNMPDGSQAHVFVIFK
jgi:hypothetical protein